MKCKRKFDGRKLNQESKEALRLRGIQQILNGKTPEMVAESFEMNIRTVYKWLAAYHYGGWEALKSNSISGRPPKLSGEQMQWLAKTVNDKNPLQLNFVYALWTLGMIRQVIRDQFGISLSEVSVGRVMRRLGFTPQRPLHRAWQRDETLVNEWMAVEYPKIKARAKNEGATIFFGDESGIRSDYHSGTTWGKSGETPVVSVTGSRYRLNMISAVSAKGEFRFITVDGSVNADVFRKFIKRLVAGMKQKIFLVLDNCRIHHAKKVKELVDSMSERIELFFLPAYSPQLNPDELAWAHVKGKLGRQSVKSKDDLKTKVLSALRALQKTPEIVRSFFQCPTCLYTQV